MSAEIAERIETLCRQFRLPTMAAEAVPRFCAANQAPALPTLAEVLALEEADRGQRRVERLRRASKLPPAKTFETLELDRLPAKLRQQLDELSRGEFLEHAVNGLAFGLPGTGKSHAVAALGHRLVEQGHAVLFAPTYQIVQDLLAAKRDLALPRALRKLDAFEVLILDDLGYLKQQPAEAEVLFTLIAERYERRSLIVTSNVVFSQWEQIFQSPMATAAAIDRIVHHSVILEFDAPSYRTAEATRARTDPTSAPGLPAAHRAERPAPRAQERERRTSASGRSRGSLRTRDLDRA
jgi:DNA replication protein DnaC